MAEYGCCISLSENKLSPVADLPEKKQQRCQHKSTDHDDGSGKGIIARNVELYHAVFVQVSHDDLPAVYKSMCNNRYP